MLAVRPGVVPPVSMSTLPIALARMPGRLTSRASSTAESEAHPRSVVWKDPSSSQLPAPENETVPAMTYGGSCAPAATTMVMAQRQAPIGFVRLIVQAPPA